MTFQQSKFTKHAWISVLNNNLEDGCNVDVSENFGDGHYRGTKKGKFIVQCDLDDHHPLSAEQIVSFEI